MHWIEGLIMMAAGVATVFVWGASALSDDVFKLAGELGMVTRRGPSAVALRQYVRSDAVVDPIVFSFAREVVPGYGWTPADIVEADAPAGLGFALWFSGLTNERLWLNQGRQLILVDDDNRTRRVNHMSIGYAEIDGEPARVLPQGDLPPQLSRQVFFETLPPEISPVVSATGASSTGS